MKIGYLMQAGVPDFRTPPCSGPAVHVRQVISELIKMGHQVRLLALLDGRIWSSDNLDHFEPVTVGWLDQGPLRSFERAVRRIQYELRLPYAALFESFRFAQVCRYELAGCDLFYERMGWMGHGGVMASRWMSIPLVLEVNGDHLAEFEMLDLAPRGIQRRLSIALMRGVARRANFVVATGEGWRQRFIEQWTVGPAKVIVIENGSQMVDLLQREQLQSFRPYPIKSQTIDLVYVGSLEPWQGIDILLRAAAKAMEQDISMRLLLVGSGSDSRRIRRLVYELSVEPYVKLTGQLAAHEVASYLAEADIGVSSYCGRVEYSGLKLLDYKAAGLATIASGENGQPAVLEHGRTGWIVTPCDEEALCEAIIHLASHPELRRQIGREARIEAEKFHSWHNTAQQLDQVFRQVVRK